RSHPAWPASRVHRAVRRAHLRLSLIRQAMSRPAEPTWSGRLEREQLAERGYTRCEHCGKLIPLQVSRCRRRRCPGYASIWARDTMRKIRENLQTYGGLACMCTVTAPGEGAGLVWDRSCCAHSPGE